MGQEAQTGSCPQTQCTHRTQRWDKELGLVLIICTQRNWAQVCRALPDPLCQISVLGSGVYGPSPRGHLGRCQASVAEQGPA